MFAATSRNCCQGHNESCTSGYDAREYEQWKLATQSKHPDEIRRPRVAARHRGERRDFSGEDARAWAMIYTDRDKGEGPIAGEWDAMAREAGGGTRLSARAQLQPHRAP